MLYWLHVSIQRLKFNAIPVLAYSGKLQASTTSLSSFQCKLKFSLFSHPSAIFPKFDSILPNPFFTKLGTSTSEIFFTTFTPYNYNTNIFLCESEEL